MIRYIIFLVLTSISTSSYSYYCATGKIEANECSGFIIEACSFIEVNAVKEGGKFYEIKKCYNSVSDHKGNRCWINIKGSNLVTKGINTVLQPDFYTYKNGEYIEIDPEYLVFNCVEK